MNSVIPFNPAQVPAHLQQAALKTIGDNLTGGLEGRGFNRISTNGKVWRFIQGGSEIGMVQGSVDVVIVGATPKVSRMFYLKKWTPGEKSEAPACFSVDGDHPSPESTQPQSASCATCPQNVLGSAISDRGEKKRACNYSKRIIVVSADQIPGEAYALDVKAMSLFGDGYPDHKAYSLNSYGKSLKEWRISVAGVRTRLTFDPNQTAPSVLFSPVGFLNAEEVAQAAKRAAREDIAMMLQQTSVSPDEVGHPQPGTPAPMAAPMAAPQAPAYQPAPPAYQPAPPAYQPPPQMAPVAPSAPVVPGAPGGFPGMPPAAPAGFPGTAPAPAPMAAPAGFPAAPSAPAAPVPGAPGVPPAAPAAPKRGRGSKSAPAAPVAPAASAAGAFPPAAAAPPVSAPPTGFPNVPGAGQAPAGFPGAAPAAPAGQTHVAPAGSPPPQWNGLMQFSE